MRTGEADEARTKRVRSMHAYPHPRPQDPEAFGSRVYEEDLFRLGLLIFATGMVCVCLLPVCCLRRSKKRRHIALLLFVFAIAAAVRATVARGQVLEAVESVLKSLKHYSRTLTQLAKDADTISLLSNASRVTSESAVLRDIFEKARDPLEFYESEIKSRILPWVETIAPTLIFVPHLVAFLLWAASSSKKLLWTVASCWSAVILVPSGLILFAVFLIANFYAVDFCWLGPARVLGVRQKNQLITYYATCGPNENPLSSLLNNLTSSIAALEDNELMATTQSHISDTVLSCETFDVDDLLYETICRRTVDALYFFWVSNLVAACATYLLILVQPSFEAKTSKAAKIAPFTTLSKHKGAKKTKRPPQEEEEEPVVVPRRKKRSYSAEDKQALPPKRSRRYSAEVLTASARERIINPDTLRRGTWSPDFAEDPPKEAAIGKRYERRRRKVKRMAAIIADVSHIEPPRHIKKIQPAAHHRASSFLRKVKKGAASFRQPPSTT